MSIQQELLLSAVWESSADSMRISDSKGIVLNVNESYCKLTGLNKKDIIGKSFSYVYKADEQPELQNKYFEFLHGSKSTERSDKKVTFLNGNVHNIEASYSRIDILGEKYVLAIIRDITDFMNALNSQRESEEKFRTVADYTYEWEYWISLEGEILYMSPSCERITGYKNSEFIADKELCSRIVHQDDRNIFKKHIREDAGGLAKISEMEEVEFRIITKMGEVRRIQHLCRTIFNSEGKNLGRRVTNRDITLQRQAEEALKENIELYHTLFDISPSGIVILDKNGIILESNKAISEILLYSHDELKGMNVRNLSLPERYEKIDNDIKNILNGAVIHNEIENIRKDGTICVIELHEKSIDLKNGEKGILATINDITLRKQAQEAETSLRKQLKKILDLVPSYIFAKDYNGKFLMVNQSLANLFGVSPEEVVGKTDADYGASPEQIEGYLKADRKVIDSGKEVFIKEEVVLRRDGKPGWFQTHKIPYRHPGINEPAILGVAVDITERKQTEEVLKESESRYRALVDLAVDGILLGSHDGIITEANESMCDILGLKKEEFVGKHISSLPFTEESLASKPMRFDLLQEGDVVLSEREIINKTGNVVAVEMRSKMMPDGTYQSIFRDITNRKNAEQKIKESKDRLQSIFRAAPTGIGVIKNRIFLEINPKISEITGYSEDELIGRNSRILYQSEEDYDFVGKEKYEQIYEKGTGVVETKWLRKDGQLINVLLASTPIDFIDINKGLTFIALDITKNKKSEEEIKLKNKELTKLNAEKDKFFSIIAHDLRNPFMGFLGFTEILKTDINKLTIDELTEIADNMNKDAKNLFSLLTNLLDWSLSQRGLSVFNPDRLDLKEVTEICVDNFRESANKKGISLGLEMQNNIFVKADKSMLNAIIRNLISNAIKFTNKGDKITITSEKSDDKIYFSIKDTGIGIPENLQKGLFKIDSRTTREGTSDEPGTGLGLLLCREFLEKNHGTISVISEEGKGSEFIFSLPAS